MTVPTVNGTVNSTNSTGFGAFLSSGEERRIITITIAGIGTVGNSLIIVVILLGSLRNSPFMMLLMNLAVVDNLVLWSRLVLMFGNIFKESLFLCRLGIFIQSATNILSSWLLVLISLERMVAVYFPLKVHMYCSLKKTYAMSFFTMIFAFSSCLYCFFTCSVRAVHDVPFCFSTGYEIWNDLIFQIAFWFLYFSIPCLIMVVLNVSIICKIRSQDAFRIRSQGPNKRSKSNKTTSMVAMLLAVCFIFCVTILPSSTSGVFFYICQVLDRQFCFTPDPWIGQLARILDGINHFINFFLYCLTGSVFREALCKMFSRRCRQAATRNPQQSPTISENIL